MLYDWDTKFDPSGFDIKLLGGLHDSELRGSLRVTSNAQSDDITITEAAFAVSGTSAEFVGRPRLLNPRINFRIRTFDPQAKLLEIVES
jgi:hypothetical protein